MWIKILPPLPPPELELTPALPLTVMVPGKKLVEKVVYIIHYFFTYNSISLSCFYFFLLPPPPGDWAAHLPIIDEKNHFYAKQQLFNQVYSWIIYRKNNQKEKQYCLSTSICLTPFLMRKDSFQTETVSRFATANSFFEKRQQRIMVFVFINTNI